VLEIWDLNELIFEKNDLQNQSVFRKIT